MSDDTPWTIGRLLNWTTDYLKDRGSISPRLYAELLLAHARQCERIELYTAFAEVVDDAVRGGFRELVRRRAEGTPVAYLVGHREFYSLAFRVTPDVLIPRPETELVVVTLLDLLKQYDAGGRPIEIVDVGTGSGAIAVSVAVHAPNCRMTAVDVSPAALDVARGNAQSHDVAGRIEFLESDLLAAIGKDRKLDFVVSNPPYVSKSEMEELPAEVRNHEPHVALLGGDSGSEILVRLVGESAERLQPGGWLIVEISPMIQDAAARLIESDERFSSATIMKDLAGHARVVSAQRRSS